MERIFLSFHFDEAGTSLAGRVQDLLRSHGIEVLNGERLGGGQLTEAIKNKIDASDGLVCLMTKREPEQNRDWIRDERAYADARGKRIVSVLEDGIQDGGMFGGHEQVRISDQDPVKAYLKLSGIISDWKQESGRFLRAILEPNQLLRENAYKPGAILEFCCWQNGVQSDWRKAAVQRYGHNQTVAYLKYVPEGAEVELRLTSNGNNWESGAQPQYLHFRLEE